MIKPDISWVRHKNSLAFARRTQQELVSWILKELPYKQSLNSLNQTSLNGQKDPELIFSLALENTEQRNPDAGFGNVIMHSDTVAWEVDTALHFQSF